VVGFVAVCVRVGMCFCTVPVDGDEFGITVNCHDDRVPINGKNFSRYKKLANEDAKTMTTEASAGSPIDFVTVAGLFTVQKV
jgi:hypothetical protein